MSKTLGLMAGALALLASSAFGDLTWGTSGLGGTGTWDSSTTNWWNGTNNVVWPNSGTAVFAGTAGTVTISSSVTADKLTFNTPGYTIQSAFLEGTPGGMTVEANADATINAIIFGAGAGTTTFTKTGSATLNLGGSFAFFGQVAISAGELRVTSFGATDGSAKYSLSNAAGEFFTLGGPGDNTFFVGGLSGGGAAGGLVRPDNVAGTKELLIFGSGGTFAGSLQDNGIGVLALTISVSSAQTLTGVNSYSGATSVNSGTLALSGGGSSLNSAFTVSNGSTLLLDNSSTLNTNRISDTANFRLSRGTVRLVGNSGASTTETLGALALGNGAGTVSVNPDVAQSAVLTFASLDARGASNTGTVLFQGANLGAPAGPGVATVRFNAAPTLTGGNGLPGSTTVSILPAAVGGTSPGSTFVTYDANGIRPLTDTEYVNNSLGAGATSNVNLNSAQNVSSPATINALRLQSTGAVSGTGTLSIASGMILGLPGAGNITVSTLDFGSAEGLILAQSDMIISSTITGSNGVLGLTKAGAGRVTLTAPNSYTGQTSVSGGVLNIQNSGALGSTTDTVNVVTTLELQGGLSIGAKPLTLGGSLRSVSGANSWAGNVNAWFATVNVDADSLTLTGSLSSFGTLTKNGNGALTITQPIVSIFDGVTMNAGTFTSVITSGTPFGSGATFLNGGTLALTPSGSGASVSLTGGANSFSNAALTYGGSGRILLDMGANNSLTYTVGPAFTSSLGRSGKGTLVVSPASGISNLGTLENLKITVGVTTTNGIVSTSIAGQNNNADKSGDFLTYNTTNGFKVATYSGSTNINTAGSTAVFNATTPQSLTAAATVYALKNSAQTITLGSNTLTIGDKVSGHQSGLIMNGGSISGGTLAFGSAEGTIYTSLAGGTISSPITTTGGVTTFGPGVLTLSGTSSYTGGTTVNGGTLKIDGSIAGNVTLGNGATLSGRGTVAGSVAGGSISPGSGAGILKAGSTSPSYTTSASSGVTTVSTNYAFEFTQTGQPDYSSAASSGNDLLRLTSATTPFAGALTSNNEIDVYFNISTGVHAYDVFFGGFYSDKNAAFDSSIQNATYKFFVQDVAGSTTFNGVSYSPYTAIPLVVSTVAQSADFGSGPVNGYVTEVQVVPEPGTWASLLGGAGLIAFGRRRRSPWAGISRGN